jgi:hypothetical protein
MQFTMSGNIDNRLFGKKPFPLDTIFDPLRQFDPIQIIPMLKSNTSGPALNQVDSLFSKVSYLLRQVNSLSWLYVVWKKNFFSTGKLSREDMSMTVILLRMHSHIDTGKRFNDRQDRKDEEVISTRSHDHNLGYTGFSLDDFKCVHRIKSCSFKKRFAPVFKIWPHKNLKNMFLQPISAVCDAIYQGMFALLFIIRQC